MAMHRILVVDDDSDLAGLIQAALVQRGYNVLIYHNAVDGIKAAMGQKPDLILMDVMLPDMSGAEAIRLLKSEQTVKDIPVIFLTGLLSREESYGFDNICVDGQHYTAVAKPFEIEDLLGKIKTNLK